LLHEKEHSHPYRDKLEIYEIKEEILEELLKTTREVEISFFLGIYLYLFFVNPRSIN